MKLFTYSKKLDEKLIRVIETNLDTRVIAIKRIDQGEVNFAYRVDTKQGLFHARIFRYEGWPETGKLKWISEKLDAAKMPQSKIIHIDESSTIFPHGFMIGEWINGKNGWSAIKEGDISFRRFHQDLAKLLKKIHATRAPHYGYLIGNGFNDYTEFQINFINDSRIQKLIKGKRIQPELLTRYQQKIKSLLRGVKMSPPVLVHGDPTPDNVIWKETGLVLVDWDDAIASVWVHDLAYLTYYSDRSDELKKAFLEGYKQEELSQSQLEKIEKTCHLRIALNLLPYYVFDNPSEEKFNWNRERLEKIL